jgi:hypothetical protein
VAEFLRGFDNAVSAIDTKKPENPADVRARLADRIRRSWNFTRLCREKGMRSEWHAGDALRVMFYQASGIQAAGRPYIPDNWPQLDASMATLTSLAVDAATSGYIATLFGFQRRLTRCRSLARKQLRAELPQATLARLVAASATIPPEDVLIERMFATRSAEIHYLSGSDIALLASNPFLEEATLHQCGVYPAQADYTSASALAYDPSQNSCVRGVLKSYMREGVRLYLSGSR